MLRGLYTAAGGMLTQQRRHDTITNNIANLNTPGYKAHTAVARSFPDMFIQLMNGGDGVKSRPIGHLNSGVMIEEVLPIFAQGDLMETGRPSDLALISDIRVFEQINGEQVPIDFDPSGRGETAAGEIIYQPQAFFTVLNEEDEQLYTRNGQFYVDADGLLRTTDGLRVVGIDGNPIELDRSIDHIRLTPNGLLLDEENGEPVSVNSQLLISQVDEPFNLVRAGNGYFRLVEGEAVQIVDPDYIEVRQGFIERSNVDPNKSIVDLMTAFRAYEANQKVIQYYDRSLDKAVNEIGRV